MNRVFSLFPVCLKLRGKFFLIVLLLFTFFLLLPQLQIPWMIIDDGENARTAAELSQHFSSGDVAWLLKFEAHNGVFRPVYWLRHWVAFSLFGSNVMLHHFGHLLWYLAISGLIFLLVKEIVNDDLAGFLAGVFWLLFFPAMENFYRLGTAEPGLVLFLLATLYFLIRSIKESSWKLFLLSLSFLLLTWFSKATAVVLAPFSFFVLFLFCLFPEKKHKNALKYLFLFFGASLVLTLLTKEAFAIYQIKGGYGSQYSFDFGQTLIRSIYYLKMIARSYSLILYVSLLSFLWRFFIQNKIKKRKILWEDKWKLAMLILFVLLLVIQTPWPFLMGRYLPPALIGLSVVAGIEVSFLLKKAQKLFCRKKRLLAVFFLIPLGVFLSYFVIVNTYNIFIRYKEVNRGEKVRAELLTFLAENTPDNGRVFYNLSDGVVEFFYEMGLNFEFFYNRPDIQTNYLFLDNGFSFKKDDIIVTGPPYSFRYPWREVKGIIKNKKEIKMVGEWEIIQISEDEEVLPATLTTAPDKKTPFTKGKFSFPDGEEPVKIPITEIPLAGGEISFFWKPPINIAKTQKKIPLIRHGQKWENLSNGLFVWAGGDHLTFTIFDPWREKWRRLSTRYEFLPNERYEVILGWGRTGMTLQAGESYQFLPYYAGLNPNEDLILGPMLPERTDFEDDIGEIDELQIFSQ